MAIDARIRYTKKVVRDCFLELLRGRSIDRITVTEICEKAELNRSTFYKYYDSPYDLLNKLEDEYLDRLQDRLSQIDKADLSNLLRIVLTDLKENREFFTAIVSENGDMRFRERVLRLCYADNMETIRTIFPGMPPLKQEWTFYFIGEGLNGLAQRWINGGMQEPISEIADYMDAMINAINRSFKLNA